MQVKIQIFKISSLLSASLNFSRPTNFNRRTGRPQPEPTDGPTNCRIEDSPHLLVSDRSQQHRRNPSKSKILGSQNAKNISDENPKNIVVLANRFLGPPAALHSPVL